jgi:hypothetical protein
MFTHQLCANLLTVVTTVRPSKESDMEQEIEDPFTHS